MLTSNKMSVFNEHSFEKKLQLLKDSQDSIQSLSTWCLQHRQHHKKIVSSWLKILKKVKIEHRLTLFYLANDVIQYSKRKNFEFVESWATALQRATPMVREERVKHRILRIFKIWDERGVYDEAFIADLSDLLNPPAKKQPEVILDPTDFQPSILFLKVRSCHKLEDDTDLRLKRLNESHVSFSDADALRRHLKDRRQGDDVVAEVDDGVSKMEAYVKALQAEIKERKLEIEELVLAEKYYEAQNGEAKIVVNAYKNFGNRVKVLKRNLDELLPTFAPEPSPVPSPDVNAPSPGPENDIELELPDENMDIGGDMFTDTFIPGLGSDGVQDQSLENCFASFIGNSLPFDIQGKPIEVINSRTELEMETSLSNFLKSLGNLGAISPSLAIPEVMSSPPVHSQPSIYNMEAEANEKYSFAVEETSSPMEPPPMPPSLFRFAEREQNDSWKSTLPTKFPLWEGEGWEEENGGWPPSKASDLETPESPPLCEKEGLSDPLEYDDAGVTLEISSDIDQRSLLASLLPHTDHHSPSLTSAGAMELSSPQTDVDQRLLHIPLPAPPPADIDHRPMGPRNSDMDHRPMAPRNDIDHRPQIARRNDFDHRSQVTRNDFDHRPHSSRNDIDHRPQAVRKNDVDHRNLISLTGSPGPERVARPLSRDQDYRNIPRTAKVNPSKDSDKDDRSPPPPLPPPIPLPAMMSKSETSSVSSPVPPVALPLDENKDNVESVDMDLSEDESTDQNVGAEMATKKERSSDPRTASLNHSEELNKDPNKPTVSFNINNQTNKLIGVSPLSEGPDEDPRSRKIPVLHSPKQQHGPAVPLLSGIRPLLPLSMPPIRPHSMPMSRPPFRPAAPPHLLESPRHQQPPPPRPLLPSPSTMQPILEMINELPEETCKKLMEVVNNDLDFTEDNCWIDDQQAVIGNGGVDDPKIQGDQQMNCPPEQRDFNNVKGRDPRNFVVPVDNRNSQQPPFREPPFREGPHMGQPPKPEWVRHNNEPNWHNNEAPDFERFGEWNNPGHPNMVNPHAFNQFPPGHPRGGFNARPRGMRLKGPPRGGGPPRGMLFGGHGPPPPRGGFRPPFMGNQQGNFGGWTVRFTHA